MLPKAQLISAVKPLKDLMTTTQTAWPPPSAPDFRSHDRGGIFTFTGPSLGQPSLAVPIVATEGKALRKNLEGKTPDFLWNCPRNVIWDLEEVKQIIDWDSMQIGAKRRA